MISQLAKAQNSWAAKLIFILVALSFGSLFGIWGYVNSASNNRVVIRVGKAEILQSQFSQLLQKEINGLQRTMGDDYELSDDTRDALIANQVQTLVNDLVLDNTADKYNIMVNPAWVQALIMSDPAFQMGGRFDPDSFRRALSENNLSEAEYLQSVKRGIARRLLVDYPVSSVQVPQVLIDSEAMLDNKRRTFRFIHLNTKNMNIDRRISEDEIAQYYEDFNANFLMPETRDVTVMHLPLSTIAANMEIDSADIAAYYNENRDLYETPQKRELLQMMFDDEQAAFAAYQALQTGADFYDVAAIHAQQSRADTELGATAEDELMEEIAAEVFDLRKGAYTKPLQNGNKWQILKVTDIIEGSSTPLMKAAVEIRKTLASERLYDEMIGLSNEIEDKIAEDQTLEDLAQAYHGQTIKLAKVSEDNAVSTSAGNTLLLDFPEIAETAFSYAPGEISRVLETADGLMLVRVDQVHEPYIKSLEEVRDEISQLWLENEKAAIARELAAEIMHNLENGDDLTKVAKRADVQLFKSQPITRNETFAGLDYADIREMFSEPLDTPRLFQQGENYIIAVGEQDYKNSAPLSETEQSIIRRNAYQALMQDFADALLSSYAEDYKIRIKYKLLGFQY